MSDRESEDLRPVPGGKPGVAAGIIVFFVWLFAA
jgi:hypothetical protein